MGIQDVDGAAARARLQQARRVVVKVGTSVVSRPDGQLALGRLGWLAEGIASLCGQGRQVLVVSSGAIGLGVERLGFAKRPRGLVEQQACAAAGQGVMTAMYDQNLGRLGLTVAQVLLTEADFHHRARCVNLAATLERLLHLGAVPLINENDVVTTDHLAVFGDNDRLAALVASNVDCDALVLLSDVDGVFDGPPTEPGAARIATWQGQAVRIGERSAGGTGGMQAKIAAAELAARAGVTTVIASGWAADTLPRVFAGDSMGTVFPAVEGLSRRRRWLAFATAPAGALQINDGARRALVSDQASLLQPGIIDVIGDWTGPAVVRIEHRGTEIARGQCPHDAAVVRDAIGSAARDNVVVHRDQLAVLVEVP